MAQASVACAYHNAAAAADTRVSYSTCGRRVLIEVFPYSYGYP